MHSVDFTVTFDQTVSGVDAGDFNPVTTGNVTGASVTGISGSNDTYTVTVATGTGDGTVRLDVIDDDSIHATADGLPLGGVGAGNGDFTTGETYTIDKTPPGVSISAPSASVTTGGPVSFTVTYTGASNVTLATGNVTLNPTGTATGTVSVSGTGASSRTVTISNISGDGTLGISIGTGTASDAAGNLAGAAGPSETFTVIPAGEGEGEDAPILFVTPERADFGRVQAGGQATALFRVENLGDGRLTGEAVAEGPFAVVSGGAYDLAAEQRQVVTVRFEPATAGEFEGALVLTGGGGAVVPLRGSAFNAIGRIEGMVFDGGTGGPLRCAVVEAAPVGGPVHIASVDETGTFILEALPAGDYTLTVYAPGFVTGVMAARVAASSTTFADFLLGAAAADTLILGRAIDAETGRALAGVRVEAFEGAESVGVTYTCNGGFYELPLDSRKGRSVTVRFTADDYEVFEDVVEVAPGMATELDGPLVPKTTNPGRLGGTVRDYDTGEALPGALVVARKSGSATDHSDQTTAAGEFLILNLDPAMYGVRASAPGYIAENKTLPVYAGDLTNNTFRLRAIGLGEGEGEGEGEGPPPRGCAGTAASSSRAGHDAPLVLAIILLLALAWRGRRVGNESQGAQSGLGDLAVGARGAVRRSATANRGTGHGERGKIGHGGGAGFEAGGANEVSRPR